jgi:hypothetical protein
MSGCFAIFADETAADGAARPIALFAYLEEAIDWGSKRYAGRAFRIRFMPYTAFNQLTPARQAG